MQIVNPFDLGILKDLPKNITVAQAEIDQLRTEKASLKSKLNLTIIASAAIIIGVLVYFNNQSITTYEKNNECD
ncbi:MAG: hypothetical protein HN600_09325 [Bacteroidetes bacterium]|nr:hypothetical protein [Bacteroidota bacterium]MBT7996946.1 hypothetical protein [Bacteroidota bacterium]